MIEKIFNDVLLITSKLHSDNRGFFLEAYNNELLKNYDLDIDFVQDNISYSEKKNTIRGLHYQKNPYEQLKFIRVINGSVFDVFIDVRPSSKTFGKYGSIILDSPEKGLIIPKGYIHGFCTLKNDTLVSYKVDALYDADSEIGVIWNDNSLNIDWPLGNSQPIISDKDKNLLSWDTFKNEINSYE